MLPKFAHIAAILPSITRKINLEIENICLKFLQTNKRAIVNSSKTLYANKAQDVLGLTRISELWTALKSPVLEDSAPSTPFGLY